MHFKLTSEVVDQIIFGMENQDKEFLFDPAELKVVEKNSEIKNEVLLSLPEWKPVHGYQLMDGFTAALKNPIYRERLRDVLNSGRGVFRGFKNIIKEREDLERAWYIYKDREMKKQVRLWYEDLCGYWDASAEGPEPEEYTDLLFDDLFFIQEEDLEQNEIKKIREAFLEEVYQETPSPLLAFYKDKHNWRQRDCDFCLKAKTSLGDTVGILTAFYDGDPAILSSLDCLYVLPEYRGTGIAKSLLEKWLNLSAEDNLKIATLGLPEEGHILAKNLVRFGFKRRFESYEIDLDTWSYEN